MYIVVETASGRAKCSSCGRRIIKGEKCIEITYQDANWTIRKKVCSCCVMELATKLGIYNITDNVTANGGIE